VGRETTITVSFSIRPLQGTLGVRRDDAPGPCLSPPVLPLLPPFNPFSRRPFPSFCRGPLKQHSGEPGDYACRSARNIMRTCGGDSRRAKMGCRSPAAYATRNGQSTHDPRQITQCSPLKGESSMWYLNGSPLSSGDINWQLMNGGSDDEEGLRVAFHHHSFHKPAHRRQVFGSIERVLAKNHVAWVFCGPEYWTIDTVKLYDVFKELPRFDWLSGNVTVKPEFEQIEDDWSPPRSFCSSICLYLTQRELAGTRTPIELFPALICDSVERFRIDYPESLDTVANECRK
jgi:hypothetical protein